MSLSIKMRLVLMGTFLAVIPTIIVGLILSDNALNKGSEALRLSAKNQLVMARELTADSIETYFSFINNQVKSMAENNAVLDASEEFSKAFNQYSSNSSADYTGLQDYYLSDFESKYQNLNNGQSSNPTHLFDELSPIAKSLQKKYISDNPAPLGEKDSLYLTDDGSEYDQLHNQYHEMFRTFQQNFGFYDVFLADAKTGHIIYSVFKELDFATSLLSGPYQNTGISEAFRAAQQGSKGETYLTDFKPYTPSYNTAASFISTGVYRANQLITVLIFQMPIDRIDGVITHHNKWQESGLGETGQTYLVGQDQVMRSNDRLLIEQPEAFLESLKKTNIDTQTLNKISSQQTTIDLLKVDSESVQQAVKGEYGFVETVNHLGEVVLSAYQPLSIQGVNWALLSEMNESEALSSVSELRTTIYHNLILVSLIALFVGALLGWLLAKIIVKPIDEMVSLMKDIAEGEGDLTQRLPVKGEDELSKLAKGINSFIGHIDGTFASVLGSVIRLKPISDDLSDVNQSLGKATDQQKQQAEKVNLCLQETNESTLLVEKELKQIGESTALGNSRVRTSDAVVKDVSVGMGELSSEITLAVEALSQLKADTDRISGVIDVINGISEQTNLLALNAAIEAARAGEAGRGFAVVADEVRTLASKTRQSTDEVADMVGAIQKGTQEVVRRMEISKANADQSMQFTDKATQSLSEVIESMRVMSEKVDQIGMAIQGQKSNFDEVTTHYDLMRDSFIYINEQTQLSSSVGTDVVKLAGHVMEHINRFNITDNNLSAVRRSSLRDDGSKAEND
ncbi:methyl-accepting chemotaxis protein [Marinomonas epiphytica]